jgi:Zn/Cd-binding protein ZinT
MKRIKLVFAVGVVMAALLALNAGSALADDELVFFDGDIYESEIEDIEIESDGELDIEFEDGGDIETYDYDVFGFDVLDIDDDDEAVHVLEID